MLPLISVIVPFRNARAQLSALVDALGCQRYPHDAVEVIWIDDGSSDGGEAWLRKQLLPGWRLLIHPRPLGAYAARNTGLD
ncbi:MAG: glycosyltransferase family 2 protein, partial [Burkholderiales bacterium]